MSMMMMMMMMLIKLLHVFSFDIGPLLLQTKYPVPENCTAFQLRDYLALKGSTLVYLLHSEMYSLSEKCAGFSC